MHCPGKCSAHKCAGDVRCVVMRECCTFSDGSWHLIDMAMNLRNYQTAFVIMLTSTFSGLGAFMGCSSPDPTQGGGSCSGDLAAIQKDIFAKSCLSAGCHGANQPAAGLDLSGANTESVLVNKPAALCNGTLVVPGDPANSVLFQKLNSPSCGVKMPIGGALSDAQIVCVYQWISALPGDGTGGNGGGGAGGGGTGGNGTGGAMGCDLCGGATCIDLNTDPMHCGSCNNTCGANMVCNMGTCSSGGCGMLTQCGASCVDTHTDVNHCGMCNNPCVGTPCTAGKCECPVGQMSCGGKCIDTLSDANNCGACGTQCAVGQSCTDGKCACGMSSVSFAGAIQPIFTANCASAGCHAGVMPQQGLNLTNGKAYNEIVNVAASQCNDGRKLVLPGDPGASYLVDKMTNTDICFGTKMPKLGSVPSAQVQSVIDWICQGAQNN